VKMSHKYCTRSRTSDKTTAKIGEANESKKNKEWTIWRPQAPRREKEKDDLGRTEDSLYMH
jgi:hypothetical protein